ncbi:hypothetical protein SAMN04487996_1046 [Dyadobacter soli]|uniref:Uncharacterized protein n=1 Tax=Dyadobacter soli TaxID=659014 RepID=A0A1G7AY42_9BACT|nr:hypothetical protein SAMN04487996_1046 [Dyadobacter soli]
MTIVLTGEWVAGLLASNAGVLLATIAVLAFWYLVSRNVPPTGPGTNNNQDLTFTGSMS